MRLSEIMEVAGTITLVSGLHIGSGNMEMHIGGTDNPVIVHPNTREPYIPGSSLKGKMRSLLEMKSGLMMHTKGEPVKPSHLKHIQDKNLLSEGKKIIKVFGCGPDDSSESWLGEIGPTRISFSDCFLSKIWKDKVEKNGWLLLEVKSENSINRIEGTARNPRFTERVPQGAEFDLLITFKVLEESDRALFREMVLGGLKLLQLDAIGGSASRGYGRIKIHLHDSKLQDEFDEANPLGGVPAGV